MSTEILVLFLTIGLGMMHVFLPGILRGFETSPAELLGPRDNMAPPQNRFVQRLLRAQSNFAETAAFALALLLLAEIAGVHTALSAMGAWIYIASRALFLPFYVFGVTGLRSLAFLGSLIGLGLLAMEIITHMAA